MHLPLSLAVTPFLTQHRFYRGPVSFQPARENAFSSGNKFFDFSSLCNRVLRNLGVALHLKQA